MDKERQELRCHECNSLQQDRRSYKDHLLRANEQVSRLGSAVPVSIHGRELEAVMEGVRRRQENSHDRTRLRLLEQGLPPVSDRDTARRLNDNLLRTERRHRAQEEARRGAAAPPHPSSYGDVSQT